SGQESGRPLFARLAAPPRPVLCPYVGQGVDSHVSSLGCYDEANVSGEATMSLPDLRGTPLAFRTAARTMIQNWNTGVMTFVLPDGREIRLEGAIPGPETRLIVHDFNFINRTLRTGTIGFGESYMAGEWDSPDLAAVLEV